MPSTPMTVTVTWHDGSTSTYVIAEADLATLVKGDIVVKFKGKKGGEATAKDYEITRSSTLDISYS